MNLYFVHHKSDEEISDEAAEDIKYYKIVNLEELKKDDWALHKKLIKEGVNPNEIASIIRKDEIEKLQEISSQSNFDYNQFIKPSLYERCSFIDEENVTLIDYAAFFGSVKCFKYLLMNGANIEGTGKYAIASGNEEIIHLCEQNHSSFKKSFDTAIKFHQNDIFKYLFESKINEFKNLDDFGKKCIYYQNYEILSYLLEKGMKINDSIINEAAINGNTFLVKCFLEINKIPKNILIFSIESRNIELVKYVLDQEGIDINSRNIYL